MKLFKKLKYELFDQGWGLLTIFNELNFFTNKYLSKRVQEYNNYLTKKFKNYFGKSYTPIPSALHNHSIHSLDAAMSVKELINHYGESGYKSVEISDHNVIMSDEEYKECSDYALKRYKMLLIPSVERAFFYQKKSVTSRRTLSMLLEAKTMFDPEKISMEEIKSLNPHKNGGGLLPSEEKVLKKVIPEYCKKVIDKGGLVIFPHPDSFNPLMRNGLTSLLNIYDYENSSIDALDCYDVCTGKNHFVLRTGGMLNEIKSIVDKLSDEYKSSVLIEDINPSVKWINMDESFNSKIHCRKDNGMFPYMRFGEEGLNELCNLFKSLKKGINLKKFRKSLVKHEGVDDYFLYFNYYNGWVKDDLIPLIKEEVPHGIIHSNSESLSLHGVSGLDFHGRGSRSMCGDLVYLNKEEDYNITSFIKALKKRKSFPYYKNLNNSPFSHFLNKSLLFTSVNKGIYLKRLMQVAFNNGKYYHFKKIKKSIQKTLSQEYGFKPESLIPFYEFNNAVISEETKN